MLSKKENIPAIAPKITPAMRREGAAMLADLQEAGASLAYAAEQVFLAMWQQAARDHVELSGKETRDDHLSL